MKRSQLFSLAAVAAAAAATLDALHGLRLVGVSIDAIVITGHASPASELVRVRQALSAVLQKPFDVRTLLAAIDERTLGPGPVLEHR